LLFNRSPSAFSFELFCSPQKQINLHHISSFAFEMSDNYDNDQVDFEEEDRNGDDNQQNDHDNFSEDRSRSDYRERHQDQRDTYDNRDEGSENHQDLDNHDVDGNKIIKPRTDGGIGVSVNGYIPNVIFISRFAPGMGKGELENFMSKFGAITEVSIKGAIAFVEFERAEDATTAKHTCHMHSGLGADTLVVDFKRDQYVPSRKVSSLHLYRNLYLTLFVSEHPRQFQWQF
jgi:hypothetical protein